MTKEIEKQIEAVAETGLTNMFDKKAVCRISEVLGFKELVGYIKADRNGRYFHFIMTGEEA